MGPRLLLARSPWASERGVMVERATYTMGSVLHVTVIGESRAHAVESISRVFEEFARLDRLLSVYKSASVISRINRAAGRSVVPLNHDVFSLLTEAISLSMHTGGLFDITLERLMRAWGFRAEPGRMLRPPSEPEMARLLSGVGVQHVELDARAQTVGLRTPVTALDLGGVAVGWTVDRAVGILRARGIEQAFINHSGDAYALGRPPASTGWSVGIPDPRNPRRVHFSVTLANRAVSTSGSYENFRQHRDHTVGHLLNPRTGRPVETHLSVTAIARRSLEADVLSTAAFCRESPRAAEPCAIESQSELITLDRSPSGGLLCTHTLPAAVSRTPLRFMEE